MRHEQDLLNRRKQAMLSQLTSLSALAAETAEKLPEVPDLDLRELPDFPGRPTEEPVEEQRPTRSPDPGADQAARPRGHRRGQLAKPRASDHARRGSPAQNRRSAGLSRPRSTS